MLRIHLFGRPRVLLDDSPVMVAGRPRLVPLLALILLDRTVPLSREAVASALWPDSGDSEARASLRRHLHYMSALWQPSPPWLCSVADGLRWNPDVPYWLDVAQFERSLAAGDPAGAIGLYGGDLLQGIDDEWIAPERERLRAAYENALSHQIGDARARADYPQAIELARRLLDSDPWREDTIRALVTMRFEMGDRAGALAQYDRFAKLLHNELGTEPMPETTAVYRAVRDGAPLARAVGVPSSSPGQPPFALPFAGRDDALQTLRECWLAATRDSGAIALIGGEAGIGKSRLTRELTVWCEARGAQVLSAACSFPEASPYEPIGTLVRCLVPFVSSLAIDPLWLEVLATLAPELRDTLELSEAPPIEHGRERTRLFEACVRIFAALAARRPALLVVEDLHWAGAGSLAMLEHLARRLRGAPVLVIATFRDDELTREHALRPMRRRLERNANLTRIALGRLHVADVETIVRRLPGFDDAEPSALAQAVHQRSEGNPFFLSEILRAGLSQKERVDVDVPVDARPIALGELPATVRHAIDGRLGRVSDDARGVIDVAAVIGQRFDVDVIVETTGWAEAIVRYALEELVHHRIIVDYGRGRGYDYRFAHDLIRAAVYDSLAADVRQRRHRRIASVMEEIYAPNADALAAEIAHHYASGNDPTLAAQSYVVAARHAASVYAHEEAVAHATRALALSNAPACRFEALLVREAALDAIGDRAAQIRDLDELEALALELDADECHVVSLRQAAFANVTSDRERERALIERLQSEANAANNPRWTAQALEAQARLLRTTGDFEGARRAFERLMELVGPQTDRSVFVAAHSARADTFVYQGRLTEARAALDELRTLVDLAENQPALVRTLMAFARASLVQQDYATMSEFARQALEISRAIGDREGEALALHTIANGLVYTFAVAEARDAYERAGVLYDQIDHKVGQASIAVDVGLFHAETGRLDRALTAFERATEVATAIDFKWVVCLAKVNAAYAYRLGGDYVAAEAAGTQGLAIAAGLKSVYLESAALGVLGAAECELGKLDLALTHLVRGVELRRPGSPTPRLGDNLRALAATHLRAGEPMAALAITEELLGLFTENPKLAPQPAEWLGTAADILEACNEPLRALELRERAAAIVRERAEAIGDDAVKAAFLDLPFNRAVVAPVSALR